MRISKTWWPNLVSVSRAVLGALLPTYTMVGDWRNAFYLAVALMFTDALDGWIANVLKANSKIGKDWVDPVSDFCLAVWGLLAWALQAPYQPWRMQVVALILAMAAVGKIAKQQTKFFRIHLLAHGFLPFFYLSLAWIFLYIYGSSAFPRQKALLAIIGAESALVLAVFKRRRLQDWIGSIRLAFMRFKNPVPD